MSEVRKVLKDAQTDLDNAQFLLFGFVVNPIRDVLLKPILGVATNIVPAVAEHVPFADPIVAFGLSTTFNVAKFTYSVLPHENRVHQLLKTTSILEDSNDHVDNVLEKQIKDLKNFTDKPNNPNPNLIIADIISFRGYLIAATVEFVSNPEDRTSEWLHAANRLGTFLKESGIDKDVKKSLLTPRWSNNLRIMGAIQHIYRPVTERRLDTKFDLETKPAPPPVSNMKAIATLMRYCTAAYGKDMMEALEVVQQDPLSNSSGGHHNHHNKVLGGGKLLTNGKVDLDLLVEPYQMGSESLKNKVCNHIGIPKEWILYFKLGYGGNMQLLRHYIVVDHTLKSIIFCIRGTQSWSGWNIDAQGMAKPFCDGLAHSGMADMAVALMENSKGEILKALNQYSGYPLLITGQSLGSGVAALFNLLCYQDKQISKHKIECHAFGGPPVYYYHQTPSSKSKSKATTTSSSSYYVDQAMKNSTLYVHREDSVPFLSCYTVHHLTAKLIAIDTITSQMSIVDQFLIGAGRKKPTSALVEAVKHGDDNLPQIDGSPKLIHPCSQIIWFMKSSDSDSDDDDENDENDDANMITPTSTNTTTPKYKYNMMQCDPIKFADLPVLVSKDMFADHVPYQYEVRLNEMEKTNIGWQRL